VIGEFIGPKTQLGDRKTRLIVRSDRVTAK
jgi:hypothetical protein